MARTFVRRMAALGGVVLATAAPTWAHAAGEGRWVASGSISTVARSGGAVYLGGRITGIGRTSGTAVVVPPSGAVGAALLPSLSGRVSAATADGEGGWYLAGAFGA